MFNKILFIIAATLPAMASAATVANSESGDLTWSIATGLGYDSNAYQAPRAPYIDYYTGQLLRAVNPLATDPLIIPQRKSGFFIPYAMRMDVTKERDQDTRLIGSAAADGRFYSGAELSSANEYNVHLHGGSEFVLGRKEKSEDTLYVGARLGKHRKVYVDHDSGLDKTTTVSDTDISDRYNYMSIGGEAKYKHKTGEIDYSFDGKYIIYDYEDPIVVSQLDHTYYSLGGDVNVPVAAKTKLNMYAHHAARNYSLRHALDAQGVYSSINNPLRIYTYNTYGAKLRNRLSSEWVFYLDLEQSRRADAFVGYDDFKENKYGARLLYEQGRFKSRLSVHHWTRDYPHAFAFDVVGQATKTYSGNTLKFKAELEQDKNSSLWAELDYKAQNTTDLRYDYVRSQIMAGMNWTY